MKLTLKQTSVLLAALACLALPTQAQKGKTLSKVVDSAISRKAIPQAVRNPHYNSVLGYNTFRYQVPYTSSTYINTTLREAPHVDLNTALSERILKDNPIQVAPILHPNQAASAFADYGIMEAKRQITQFVQAYYLWRLAHPQITDVRSFPKLFREGATQIFKYRNSQTTFENIDEYQAIRFLEIIDYGGRLKSYRELADKTTVYPKLITLDEKGWPGLSKGYRKARELDTYLLQSRWQGEYYNSVAGNHYSPFVLTKEEQQAADRLFDLRVKGDALPENPTERDLLANMYNQLERELWPYYEQDWVTEFVLSEKYEYYYYTDYMSYIDYAKNPTAIAIRKRIQDAGDTAWQESLDMAHLMVMDFMINKGPETFSYYKNALEAYKKVYQEIRRYSGLDVMARLEGMGRIVARKAVFAKNFEGEDEINQLGREIGELVK